MAAKYKPKTTVTKKISVREFKAWLSGVEEMQPEGWFPDVGQWKKIRDKISTLDETAVEDSSKKNISGSSLTPTHSTEPFFPTPTGPVVRRVNTTDAPLPPSAMSAMQAPPIPSAPIALSDGKTPNLDTSKEGYKSPFV